MANIRDTLLLQCISHVVGLVGAAYTYKVSLSTCEQKLEKFTEHQSYLHRNDFYKARMYIWPHKL